MSRITNDAWVQSSPPTAMPFQAAVVPVAARNPNDWIPRNLSIVTIVRIVRTDSRIWHLTSQAIHPCSSARHGKPARSDRLFAKRDGLAPNCLILSPCQPAAGIGLRANRLRTVTIHLGAIRRQGKTNTTGGNGATGEILLRFLLLSRWLICAIRGRSFSSFRLGRPTPRFELGDTQLMPV
jgi:hypothetical protein